MRGKTFKQPSIIPISVNRMNKARRIIYPAILTATVIVIVLLYPLAVIILSAGAFVFLLISRQLNFYRIFMMLKQAARNISKLRSEFRARLHMGFRDCSNVSANADEELHRQDSRVRKISLEKHGLASRENRGSYLLVISLICCSIM